jgi:hypothetical protein
LDQSKTPLVPPLAGRYDVGATTVYAARRDPRFSYCLYVPDALGRGQTPGDIVAVVHGSPRTFMDFRDRFGDFAERHNVVVVSPLFPVGLDDDAKGDDYKYLSKGGIRYDRVLLDIVAEVRQRFSLHAPRFGLFGFSGGAQFVNRFLLLQPDSLWAASLGAPGSVTVVDDSRDWWVGTRDIEACFGSPLNREALRRVPVQLLVGSDDLKTDEITHREGGRFWMTDANSAGRSRPQRLETLQKSLALAGVSVTHQVMQGAGHDAAPAIEHAKPFLAAQLLKHRQSAQVTAPL